MENTVVGVYDSYAQAQNVMNELLACGFSPGEVRLSPGTSGTSAAPQDTHGVSGIRHFFRSLFGMESEEDRGHHDIYAEALRRGSCLVTVNAAGEQERERAVDVMNRFGPVDIEERASQWRSSGWTGYGQAHIPAGGEDVRAGQRAVQRGAVRVYPRTTGQPAADTSATGSGAGGDYADTAMTSDDSDYRTHWQNAYGASGGSYEDYDAAYRYGTMAGGSERYRNYRWEDAEPGMRSDWERDHPESAWERVRDAVRYGAERVAGRNERS